MSTIRFNNDMSAQSYHQLRVQVEPEYGIVWLYMNPYPRPCFNSGLLTELRRYQRMLTQYDGKLPHEGELVTIRYQVLGSDILGVFNLGGDLERFLNCIRSRDSRGLLQYAKACIDVLYPNITCYNLPITPISLIRGDALGGGFEAALSSRVVIAERCAQMGLPEILFNLFPGMGAYNLLAQRLNPVQAERMILSGRMYSAEELYEMGVVDVLAEDGEGEAAVRSYIRAHSKRYIGHTAVHRIRQRLNPIRYDELMDICDIWVDAAMQLTEKDLRVMERLVRAQNRIAEPVGVALDEDQVLA